VRKAHRPLAELAAHYPQFPQQLTNLTVRDKQSWRRDNRLTRELQRIRDSYPAVRFYLRPSGTENLVRILTESQDAEQCRQGNEAACRAFNDWNER
jgi:phosphomannomutase